MVLQLSIGLVKIPIATENFSKSRYSISSLHNFSTCCNEAVGNKNYCKGCGKDLDKSEIVKGIDKNTILSEEQQKSLKENLESGIMEVLSVQNITETTTYDILPYVVKALAIMPNISKGFKKGDIKVFFSFKKALKDSNKFCLVKLTQRALEHIGILMNWKNELVFIELPFKHYNNFDEIESSKANLDKIIKEERITELEGYTEQAGQFISNYKNKVNEINEIKEEKKVLLKTFLEDIEKGIKTEIKPKEDNPFAV